MLLVSGGYSLLMSGWIAGLGLKVHWVTYIASLYPRLGCSKLGFQIWSFKRKVILIIFVYNLTIDVLKRIEAFKQKEWRNQVIIEHWVCSTWPLNNQAQEHKLILMNYQESLIAMHQHPIQGSKAQSSFNSKVIIVDYKSWDKLC